MLRALATLLGLAALTAWGAEFRPANRSTCRSDGRSRMCMDPGTGGSGGGPPPLLRILPLNGAGVPVMDPGGVCDAFAGELVGNFVCMRGDGTSVLGSGVTLTKSGAVTTTSPRICPNGAACDPVTVQAFDGIGAWTANQSAPPAGNFSMCALARLRAEVSYPGIVRLGSGSTYVQIASTTATIRVAGVGPNASIPAPAGRWIFACGTYRRVAAGTSVGTIYVDGAAGISASNLPLPVGGDLPMGTGSQNATDNLDIALALYTEKELSAATILAMSQKVRSGFTDSEGGAVGFQRTSTASCIGPDGRITNLASLVPCISQPTGFGGPALEVERARTNSALQSQALETWTGTGATVTTNTTVAPDSTITADTLTDDTSTGEHLVLRITTLTNTNPHIASAFFRAGTTGFAVLRYATSHYAYINTSTGAVASTGTGAVVTSQQLADGWWRLMLSIPTAQTLTNPTIAVGPASALGVASYTGSGSGTVVAWGLQMETGSATDSNPSIYARADGTAAARLQSQINQAFPVGMSNTTGCVAYAAKIQTYLMAGTQTMSMGNGNSGLNPISAGYTQVACGDNTGVTTVNTPSHYTNAITSACSWAPGVLTVRAAGAFSSGAYVGPMLGSTFTIGSKTSGGAVGANGWVSDFKLGNDPNACN